MFSTPLLAEDCKQAKVLLQQGLTTQNLEEKVVFYQQAILLCPDYVDAYQNLAVIYQKLGEIEQAMVAYRKVLTLNPQNASVHYSLGDLYREKGIYLDEAIRHYQTHNRLVQGDPREQKWIRKAEEYIQELRGHLPAEKILSSEQLVEQLTRKTRITLGTVKFDYNSADLYLDPDPQLEELGKAMISEVLKAYRFSITVHTDDFGSEIDNQILSENRARRIQAYLTERFGVTPKRLTLVGYGELKPIALNETEQGQSWNPRVEIFRLNPVKPAELPRPTFSEEVGKMYAILIGIGVYKDPTIPALYYTVRDAEALYALLLNPKLGGYTRDRVTLLVNQEATLKRIREALESLAQKTTPEDTVFLFYSGYSQADEDIILNSEDRLEKYIIPYDTDPKALSNTALRMTEIKLILDRIQARQVTFWMDSCYRGASILFRGDPSRNHRSLTKGGDTGIKSFHWTDLVLQELSGQNRIIVTASNADELALEVGKLGHGVFTYYLLEAMRGAGDANGDGWVTAREAYQFLYPRVIETSLEYGLKQTPMKYGWVQIEPPKLISDVTTRGPREPRKPPIPGTGPLGETEEPPISGTGSLGRTTSE